ncbi:MAG: hypothetical protein LBE25_13445 [Arthrobacter sp.]|jgi:hypothetical protein|nr:hypothetical protein [Arthrobacter sp.]
MADFQPKTWVAGPGVTVAVAERMNVLEQAMADALARPCGKEAGAFLEPDVAVVENKSGKPERVIKRDVSV